MKIFISRKPRIILEFSQKRKFAKGSPILRELGIFPGAQRALEILGSPPRSGWTNLLTLTPKSEKTTGLRAT